MSNDDLLDQLRRLYEELTTDFRARLNRSFSLGEMIVDGRQRARMLGFGEGTTIYESATVMGNVTVGRNCWIGQNAVLDGSGDLTVGDWCTIGVNAFVASHSAAARMISGGKSELTFKATTISNRCFIGPFSLVEMGVTIGEGCMVNAHAVVKRSLPAGSIAHGNPARIIGQVKLDDAGEPVFNLNRAAVDLYR